MACPTVYRGKSIPLLITRDTMRFYSQLLPSLQIAQMMFFFNDRCYDVDAFEVAKQRSANECVERGQRGLFSIQRFKYPISKEICIHDFAISNFYKTKMIKSKYAEFIHRKIPSVDVDDTVRH